MEEQLEITKQVKLNHIEHGWSFVLDDTSDYITILYYEGDKMSESFSVPRLYAKQLFKAALELLGDK